MTMGERLAALFRLDDEGWARHANPWSVWTRTIGLPLLALAVWSRAWIGAWALLPVALAATWIWVNPRLFPAPRSITSWASRAVLGERLWLNRKRAPVPAHHRLAPHLLNATAALGLPFVIWGLAAFALWPLLFGAALIYAGKLWFLDRMVWLYEDMKGEAAGAETNGLPAATRTK